MKIPNAHKLPRLCSWAALTAIFCLATSGEVNADEVRGTADTDLATVTSKVSRNAVQVAEPLTLEYARKLRRHRSDRQSRCADFK